MAMTVDEAMGRPAARGDEKRRAINAKNGAGENQYGVPMGEIRKLAAGIKSDHALGMALWATGNIDAQLLGILVIKPKALSRDELDGMVRAGRFGQVADWLGSYVIKNHPDKEMVRRPANSPYGALRRMSGRKWYVLSQRSQRTAWAPEGL